VQDLRQSEVRGGEFLVFREGKSVSTEAERKDKTRVSGKTGSNQGRGKDSPPGYMTLKNKKKKTNL